MNQMSLNTILQKLIKVHDEHEVFVVKSLKMCLNSNNFKLLLEELKDI